MADDLTSLTGGSELASGQTWDRLQKYVLTKSDPASLGISLPTEDEMAASAERYDTYSRGLQASLDSMNEVNQSFLAGEVPNDVAVQVAKSAAAKAQVGGIFGQSARALSARDLGLTSLDLVQKGVAQQASIADLQRTSAAAESSRENWMKALTLSAAEVGNAVRQTNLGAIDTDLKRQIANVTASLQLTEYMTDLMKAQQQIGYQYSYGDMDPANAFASFDNFMGTMDSKYGALLIS